MKYYLIRTQAIGGPLWWRPHAKGYTNNILEAGVYSKQEARSDRPIDSTFSLSSKAAEIREEIEVCRARIKSGEELLIMLSEDQEDGN